MDDTFRDMFEGLRQTAEGLIAANEGIKRRAEAALRANEEQEDLRATVQGVEALVLDLVERVKRNERGGPSSLMHQTPEW